RVIIIFDSDASTNGMVLWAEWHLSEALQARCADVRVVRLPGGPVGSDGVPAKVGLDDLLVAYGPDKLRELIDDAQKPERPGQTVRETENGVEEKPAHPPPWCVNAVHARGAWDGLRPLYALTQYPVLRPDGSVLTQPGYDEATGLIFAPFGPVNPVPDRPTAA